MKRRVFFIIIAIIQIVISIYVIATADTIVAEEVEAYKQMNEIMPMDMMEEMITTLETRGASSLIVCSGICILVNIGVFFTAIKNTILRNKGLMIAAMVVSLVFGGNDLAILLAVIGLIILLASKRVNPEDFPEKKEIPVLEKIETNRREVIIGIALAVVYFSQFIWGQYVPESGILSQIIKVGFYAVVFVLAVLFWKKSIKRDLKALKDNLGTYMKFILPRLGIMYLIYLVVNLIAIGITGTLSSENQKALEAMNSWFVVPLAIIYAPVVEETLFRGLIRKVIKNKYLFIIISAICFGVLHTFAVEVTLLNIIVKALPYAVLGGFLAILYERTENITTSMLGHFLINLFASLVTLI